MGKIVTKIALASLILTGLVGCSGEPETNENGDILLYECESDWTDLDGHFAYKLKTEIYGTDPDEPFTEIATEQSLKIPVFEEYYLTHFSEIRNENERFNESGTGDLADPKDTKYSLENKVRVIRKRYFPTDTEALKRSFKVKPSNTAREAVQLMVENNELVSKACEPKPVEE